MKRFLIILFLLMSLSLYSQDTIYISYYDNGQEKEQLSFENNKLNGTCYCYSQTGILTGIATYKNGIKHGEWKIWREDGTLAYEMYYKNGKKTGVWKQYDNQGNIVKEKEM